MNNADSLVNTSGRTSRNLTNTTSKHFIRQLLAAGVVLGTMLSTEAGSVINGTFEAGFNNAGFSGPSDLGQDTIPQGWTRYETFSGGIPETAIISPVNLNGPSAPGGNAVLFVRAGDNMSGDFTSIWQPLNLNVAGLPQLTLSMDVMVISHNLEAGGWVAPAFEWPVVVQINYTATDLSKQIWRFGWYLNPPGDDNGSPINDPGQGLIPIYNDLQVQNNVWVANTFNLLNELPKVQTLDGILVGGSGWDYEGVVDNVLIVPEPQTWALIAGLGLIGLAVLRRGQNRVA